VKFVVCFAVCCTDIVDIIVLARYFDEYDEVYTTKLCVGYSVGAFYSPEACCVCPELCCVADGVGVVR